MYYIFQSAIFIYRKMSTESTASSRMSIHYQILQYKRQNLWGGSSHCSERVEMISFKRFPELAVLCCAVRVRACGEEK